MRTIAAYVTENTARAAFLAMSALVVGAVAINALALQQGRHPAPFAMRWSAEEAPRVDDLASLFDADDTHLGPTREIIVDTGLVLDIQRALSALGYYDGAIDGLAGGQTVAAIHAFEVAAGLEPTGYPSTAVLAAIKLDGDRVARAPDATGTGGITSIEDLTRASEDRATGGVATGDPTVARVQRTLADLGYAPGPIDGMMGPSTRRAIADFQRDRALPQTGELTPGLIVELDSML